MGEQLGLENVLVLLVNGAGGVVVYWALERVKPFSEWFGKIENADTKRWAVAGITGLLGLAAWLGMIGLELAPAPAGGWRPWVIAGANVLIGAAVAFETSQLGHTKVLKARRLERASARAVERSRSR